MADKPTKEQIREALMALDVENKDHWTNEGLPALDALKQVLNVKVTRAEVTDAAPMFNRDHRSFEDSKPANDDPDEVDTEMTQEEEFQAVKNQLDEIDAQMESLRKRKEEVQVEHDRLNTALSGPKMSEAENIAQYLERAQAERAAKVLGK